MLGSIHMKRRALLASALAMVSVPGFGKSRTARDLSPDDIPDFRRYRTLAEVRGRIAALQAAHPKLVSRREIGRSRYGQPIELVTLAGGRRSALVIAGVHANEQVGGLTADYLMTRLASDAALRAHLDTTWHFISPIDPDGMLLNEGWFEDFRSLRNVMRHYYRPAFQHQADYTFPVDVPGYTFSRPSPENLAWQRALELTRPDWQFPIHNAGIGGAFFLTSRPIDRLDRRLSDIPGAFGIDLSAVGEPLSNFASRRPGIFTVPSLAEMMGEGKPSGWTAGGTSGDFARRYGTFSITAEVPVWIASPATGGPPPFQTIADVVAWRREAVSQGFAILDRWTSRFQPRGVPTDELLFALQEQVEAQRRQLAAPAAQRSGIVALEQTLTAQEAFTYRTDLQLIGLRPHALLARLARDQGRGGAEQAEAEAQGFVDARIKDLTTVANLEAAPLRSIVGVQAAAALATAETIGSGTL